MMNPVSDAEMASIRAAAAQLCDLTCTIQRGAASTTPPNGWDGGQPAPPDDLTTVGTTPALKRTPSPALLTAAADRLATLTIWQMSFPWGTDVQEQDTLIINGEKFKAETKVAGSYDALLNFLVSEVV